MRLTKKLLLGFLAISVFSAIVGYVGYTSMKFVDRDFSVLAEETVPTMMLLKDLKVSMYDVFTAASEDVPAGDACGNSRAECTGGSRSINAALFEESFSRYSRYVDNYSPEDRKFRDAIRNGWGAFAGLSGKIMYLKETNASRGALLAADKEFYVAKKNLEDAIDSALAEESGKIQEKKERISTTISRSMVAILIIIALSIASAAINGIIFARSITRSVIELTHASSDIKGDYSAAKKLSINSDDEIGELAGSFNKMIEDLKKRDNYISFKNRELEESKKELERKIGELERFNKIAVDRELKMIELKKKIRELEERK